jgi:endoribonuclease Dicer
MPLPGYLKDLSELVDDHVLSSSNTDSLLIDTGYSPTEHKYLHSSELTESTLAAMLQLNSLDAVQYRPPIKAAKISSSFKADSYSEKCHNNLSSPVIPEPSLDINTAPTMSLPVPSNFNISERDLLSSDSIVTISPWGSSLPQTCQMNLDATSQPQVPTTPRPKMEFDIPCQKSSPAQSSETDIDNKLKLDPTIPSYTSHKEAHISPIQPPSTTLIMRTTDVVIADLVRYTGSQESIELSLDGESDLSAPVSDEEDVLEDLQSFPKQRQITERKRHHNAIADTLVQKINQQLVNEGLKLRPEDEAQQSARWLVNQTENRQIISSPREYQLELFEKAKEKNVIAVLDTGSGKTLIAVLLLRHIFAQELEQRALGKRHRISFFLVDSVQLVFQQHAVLKANLDQPMNMFCGDMGCDLWNKVSWDRHFSENMVIVCTAEVLRQCLHHSFISMDQINLLIFDEAHHAKKDHAYARIIKDFYVPHISHGLLPKIFGMTASPVDARVDVRKAAAELEAIMHCEIATAADLSLLQYTILSKQEQIAMYAPLSPPVETALFRQMAQKLETNRVLSKPLIFAREASRELGVWCSDQVWPFCLTEEETKKLQAKTERRYHSKKVPEPLCVLEEQKAQLQEARNLVEKWEFELPDYNPKTSKSSNLSSKVVLLIAYLKQRFERPTDDKCIVFVRQRYTARLLAKLFSHQHISTPHLHVGTLVSTKDSKRHKRQIH